MRALFLSLCCLLTTWAADGWERHYAGTLMGQPAVAAREVVRPLPDGGRETRFTLTIVLARALGGGNDLLRFVQDRVYNEDADGRLRSFHFDDDENGTRILSQGTVTDEAVLGTMTRAGRERPFRIELNSDTPLYGQQGAQSLIAAAKLKTNDQMTFYGIERMGAEMQLVASEATLQKQFADGSRAFSVAIDLLPDVPAKMTVGPDGDLRWMRMSMGPLSFTLAPTENPVEPQAATLDLKNLVQAKGRPRASNEEQYYRVPAQARDRLPVGDFQSWSEDGRLLVRAQALPGNIETTAWLAATPSLEIDDPRLHAWVGEELAATAQDTSERIRVLTSAVRRHLASKDLSQADNTALEAFVSQRGDCTEHANLLAAALRIAGIPSRVEVGVVWVDSQRAWIGHAWCAAYDGTRWVLADAAYPGLTRNLYIAAGIAGAEDSLPALLAGVISLLGGEITAE